MYAAAGGAVKQARKRQQLQTVKDKAEQARLAKEKLEAAKAAELASHPKSKQFHQLPANYLRAPQAQGRKLSHGGYTGHGSKLLLPISEQSAQHHSPSQQTLQQHHQRHGHHYSNEPRTPTHGHHDHKKLARSATASFPLVSHAGTPPASPGLCCRQHQHFFKQSQSNLLSTHQHNPIHIQIPQHGADGIIITPATPLPSPSPSSHQLKQQQQQHLHHRCDAEPIVDDMPEFPLERTCSVYRNRKLDETTTVDMMDDEYQQQQLQQQFYPGGMPNGNGTHHTHWADELCDVEGHTMDVCTCDHIEVKVALNVVSRDVGKRRPNRNIHSRCDVH